METFKVVRMEKRGDQMPAEFRHDFLEQQGELKRAAKKVVASFTTGAVEEPTYDGVSAAYYGSATEARAALGDDPARLEVACSEMTMAQKADADRVIKPAGQLKTVRTMIRRKDLTLAEFKDYWLQSRSKLDKRVIAESPAIRIVASFALPPEPGGNEPQFDGMVEIYFASIDDVRELFTGPLGQAMREDDENFIQPDAPAIRLLAEEVVL